MSVEAAGYVVVQEHYAIFGYGITQEAAWAEAEEWADLEDGEWPEDFACYPATAALLAEVEARGGDIPYGRVGGVCCTLIEEEAAA